MQEYKGYKIVGDGTFGYKRVQAIKGSIPQVLAGSYTTEKFARTDIDRYLASKGKK